MKEEKSNDKHKILETRDKLRKLFDRVHVNDSPKSTKELERISYLTKTSLLLIIVLTLGGCCGTIQQRPYYRSSERYINYDCYNPKPYQCNFQREYHNAHKQYTNY